MGTINIVLQ